MAGCFTTMKGGGRSYSLQLEIERKMHNLSKVAGARVWEYYRRVGEETSETHRGGSGG